MTVNVKRVIEFLELFKEVSPGNTSQSIYRWQELLRVLPHVRILSYKVTEPMGNQVESIQFAIITDAKPGQEQGYTYTLTI